ncbi:MAG: hypothetical protein LBD07_01140 [Spirochaetaceae bacterium]|jgi:hypothetical protein|nr:hypothetical protein [Spirochaetaceae bacterium]
MRIRISILLLLMTVRLAAQDFGFGDEAAAAIPDNGQSVSVSGEASASFTGYTDDFLENISEVKSGDLFSGKINFSAKNSFAESLISLKLSTIQSQAVVPASAFPVAFDEAFVRMYIGGAEVEAGLRKLTWGKADSFGPLDITNPYDYTELTNLRNLLEMKIARPLVHLTYRLGEFSKIEGLFIPYFEGSRFDTSGRWKPSQMDFSQSPIPISIIFADTSTLAYAQEGLRLTATVGSSDIGIQYYHGRINKPAYKITLASPPSVEILYNEYNQIGIDWARVIAGFNIRAETAANITSDFKGDDGSVYNPSIAWSLGFDRDIFWSVNLNIQANESIRLMNNKTGSADIMASDFDIEGGKDATYTRITAALSKKFFRDELELRTAVLWDIEDNDFFIVPAVVWTKDSASVECSGGIFGGDDKGELGQYYKNCFAKIILKYLF